MSSRVDISTVLDFDGLCQAFDQSPELALDIILCFSSVSVENRVKWHF